MGIHGEVLKANEDTALMSREHGGRPESELNEQEEEIPIGTPWQTEQHKHHGKFADTYLPGEPKYSDKPGREGRMDDLSEYHNGTDMRTPNSL